MGLNNCILLTETVPAKNLHSWLSSLHRPSLPASQRRGSPFPARLQLSFGKGPELISAAYDEYYSWEISQQNINDIQKMLRRLHLLLLFASVTASGETDPGDVSALKSLMTKWKNSPPSWDESKDPCGALWDGVSCNNSRVTELRLFNMGLEGTLSEDIGKLDQLQILDLSYNRKLGGQLTSAIGNLPKLKTFFVGIIPDELGNLGQLTSLSLNSNQFTGGIPVSLGKLSNLDWLDLADNQLNGSLPTSMNGAPGLDQLFKAGHFHFNKNNLSGPIPESLFNANMTLRHVLLDRNQLIGEIPESVGLVLTLEILRLNNNKLNGTVPSSISNLANLHLSQYICQKFRKQQSYGTNAQFNCDKGAKICVRTLNFKYLLQMELHHIICRDLSNNSFLPSEAPSWFSYLKNITTLIIESGGLHGPMPQELFSVSQLEKV
ncbi:putative leucine-rich repeat receptor-like protein kinase [Ananas comosus]|uniref:Putative leucine-rich repeat receptor-like protein kinase n=1 Tax=Ananas comosus TaxID=4615 RepID=A0A199V2S3_ANACO|nr:putative leucine-rich repeat receptor-like protein kinase [Ananas comosus]